MKISRLTIIIAALSSVVLFFAGHILWGNFFDLLLPVVGNVRYLDTDLGQGFRSSIFFGLTLALVPLLTVLIWKLAHVYSAGRRFLTVCILIISIATAVLLRREIIKSKARNMEPVTVLDYSDSFNPEPQGIVTGIPVSTLRFELFAFAGLVAGGIVSYFLLQKKA